MTSVSPVCLDCIVFFNLIMCIEKKARPCHAGLWRLNKGRPFGVATGIELLTADTPICLRIAVCVPVRGTFFYRVPRALASWAEVGCQVIVPFKNRKVSGYILEIVSQEQDLDLKDISEIPHKDPLFHSQQVPFYEWISEYYIQPIGKIIQSALPDGMKMGPFKSVSLTEDGSGAIGGLAADSEDKEILCWVRDHPGKRPPWPLQRIYALEKLKWLTVEEGKQKRSTAPLIRKFVRPKKGVDLETILAQGEEAFKAKGEVEFLKTAFSSEQVRLSELGAKFSNGRYLVKKWVGKGVLEDYKETVYRNPVGDIAFFSSPPLTLYDQQREALESITAILDKKIFSSCLLYGVTGSGKTEVYCRAIDHVFRSGRQAILILPEISLATYMENIFRSRFGPRISVYHSGLSAGERFDQWMRMVGGEVDLVIGARSALFAPLPRLGLIIVDEEHDPSFKQENNPRYNGRDMAVVRAKVEDVLVILGSGTPSIQSYQNCMSGRYHLLEMPERVEKRPLPEVEVVDMKTLQDKHPENRMISPRLKLAIEENLKAGNQALLFLNRRGFHRLYLCRFCGRHVRCPNCDVALTYHLKQDLLSCHYCGFYSAKEIKCPSCGGKGLKAYGFGTEKLEHELKELFPSARIDRMDADSTRRKGEALMILKRFGRQETDILVGTQMVTKGYDFPKVTLVGVIAADLSLGFPDFRAGERTFQILSQVAGRAGRGPEKGRVIIQTFNPDHYSIKTAVKHDFSSFFRKERELRKRLGYPPFSHLACLKLQGNDKDRTAGAAQKLGLDVRRILAGHPEMKRDVLLLGPVEAPIARLKGKYRWQMLVKSRRVSLLKELLVQVDRHSIRPLQASGVQLISDVDPYQMI